MSEKSNIGIGRASTTKLRRDLIDVDSLSTGPHWIEGRVVWQIFEIQRRREQSGLMGVLLAGAAGWFVGWFGRASP